MTTETASPEAAVALTRTDLARAARDGLISDQQADALWAAWAEGGLRLVREAAGAPAGPRFGFTNVLYYFGGMVAIGAMSLFMGLGWAAFGPGGLLAITLAAIAACLFVAQRLEQHALPTPAGILATLAIVLVPLAAWCAQHLLGLWPEGTLPDRFSAFHERIDWRWLTLEAVTLAAGLAMLVRHRQPFMVMPIAVTLWYVSMDLADGIVRSHAADAYAYGDDSWALRRQVSLVFGLLTLLAAVWVDLRLHLARSRKDFAFWLHLFGAIMAWSALSLSDSGSPLGKLGYCAVNVALVFYGAAIGRRVYTVLGALGVTFYLGDLSHTVFRDSLMFPFMLCLLGLGIVALGVWWQRHEAALQARLAAWLPAFMRPLATPFDGR
jgi:hypothetical protein